MRRRPTSPNRTDTPYPYTTLFRSNLRLDHLLSKEFGGTRWPLWSEELPPFQRTFAAVLMSLHPGDRQSEPVAIAEQACMPQSGPSGASDGTGADRKSVEEGKGVAVRVALGGRQPVQQKAQIKIS